MTNVVYRFDYYGLMHGPKQGGFALSIPTHVLVSLLSKTPHNVDSPVAAMVMTVQIATWGEWAQGLLFLNGPR